MTPHDYKPHGPFGNPIDPDRCRAAVHGGRGVWFHQCSRKPMAGERYCRQHHPDTIARRYEERRQRWREEDERARRSRVIHGLGLVAWECGIRTEDELRARLGENPD